MSRKKGKDPVGSTVHCAILNYKVDLLVLDYTGSVHTAILARSHYRTLWSFDTWVRKSIQLHSLLYIDSTHHICACTVQCTHTVQSVHVRRPVNIQSTVHSIPRQSMPIAIIRRYTTVWVRNSGNQGGEKGDMWLSQGTVQKMNLRRLTLNSSSNNNVRGSVQIKDTNCNQKLVPIISRRHQTWKGTKIIYIYYIQPKIPKESTNRRSSVLLPRVYIHIIHTYIIRDYNHNVLDIFSRYMY